ncbi:hypothetical protein K438DRAFT_777008 [Mycena galopus ATCC 62051]|nr:hypothetical protein K438DRAFT_777008 [Mycena galopus ATCC 62051]
MSAAPSVSAWGQALGFVPHHPLPDTALLLGQERQLRVGLAREAQAPTVCEFEHTLNLTLCATPILPSLAACPAVLVFYLPFPSARTLDVSLYPRHGSRRRRLSGFVTTLIAVCSFVCICVRVWTSACRPASSPPPRAPLRSTAVPAAYRLRMGRIPIRLAQCADRVGRAGFSSGLAHSVSTHTAPPPAPPSLVHPHPQTASSSWPPALHLIMPFARTAPGPRRSPMPLQHHYPLGPSRVQLHRYASCLAVPHVGALVLASMRPPTPRMLLVPLVPRCHPVQRRLPRHFSPLLVCTSCSHRRHPA